MMFGWGFVLLCLAGLSHTAPGWMGDNYEEMMRSISNIKPDLTRGVNTVLGDARARLEGEWRDLSGQVEELGDYWGDHLETVGQQMGSRFRKFGNNLEDRMTQARDKMSHIGNQVGDSVKNSFNQQFGGDFDQHLAMFQQRINQEFGNIGHNLDNFGNGLLSQFDRGFSRVGNFDDIFGVFGRRQTPWWQLENVCTTREVLEEEDREDELNIQMSGSGSFHLQVNQCVERPEKYECVKTVADQGTVSTLKLTYSCCHGYKNLDGSGCSSLEMTPLEETIADLEGSQFLELLVEAGLEEMMNNVTVFVPNDDAIQDFTRELEDVGLVGEDNIVYNIDEGLLNKRRKRNIQISEGPEMADILAGHLVSGFHNIRDLVETELVQSENSEKNRIRVTVYPTRPEPTVMANCAKVVSRDNHATNGVVQVVDKVIVPAVGTIADVLSSDLHFGTFVSALEKADLAGMLSEEEGHFTVFAPTDSAFEKLEELTRQKVVGGLGCGGDLLRSHILHEVVCSGVVEEKVKVVNAAGHEMILEVDQEGNVLVGGVKLMLRDKMTTNGVIHVIDEVIVLPEVRGVIDQLKARHANNLLDLLDKAGLTAKLDTMEDFTLFAPSEQAISELPRAVLEELAEDKEGLEEILLHHVVREHSGSLAELEDNTEMKTAGGGAVRVNRQGHGRAMVQCSRVLRPDEKVCGGRLHTIDRVLTPPRGDVLQTLQALHPKFARLVALAGLEEELAGGRHTVLAPLDQAFSELEEEITDSETAEQVVRSHLITSPLCCASVLRTAGFLHHELRVRSSLGETLAFHRSNGGNIYANKAAIVRCDQAASNGVVHTVDSLLLPRNFNNKKTSSFWDF